MAFSRSSALTSRSVAERRIHSADVVGTDHPLDAGFVKDTLGDQCIGPRGKVDTATRSVDFIAAFCLIRLIVLRARS